MKMILVIKIGDFCITFKSAGKNGRPEERALQVFVPW